MTETYIRDKDDEDRYDTDRWQIIEGIKRRAADYLRDHPGAIHVVIHHRGLESKSDHELTMIRQRLNGFPLREFHRLLAWNPKHKQFCIELLPS